MYGMHGLEQIIKEREQYKMRGGEGGIKREHV
jgi:hypothetical protein